VTVRTDEVRLESPNESGASLPRRAVPASSPRPLRRNTPEAQAQSERPMEETKI